MHRYLLVVLLAACAADSEAGGDAAVGEDGSSASDAAPPDGCDAGPLPAPRPGCNPEARPQTDDPKDDCVARINQLRWDCQCLPPLRRWTNGEACADMHAAYDAENNTAHGGVSAGICEPGGWGQNECPGYVRTDSVITQCLQAMWDEGPGEPFEEHGHYLNMTNPSFSQVACGFATDANGGIWSVQNFR